MNFEFLGFPWIGIFVDDFWFFWFVILFFSLFGLLCFAVEYFLIVGFHLLGQVLVCYFVFSVCLGYALLLNIF